MKIKQLPLLLKIQVLELMMKYFQIFLRNLSQNHFKYWIRVIHFKKYNRSHHGGKIWGENNKDGKGATFGFRLPIKNRLIN